MRKRPVTVKLRDVLHISPPKIPRRVTKLPFKCLAKRREHDGAWCYQAHGEEKVQIIHGSFPYGVFKSIRFAMHLSPDSKGLVIVYQKPF